VSVRSRLPLKKLRGAARYLPDNIYDAMDNFQKAERTTNFSGPAYASDSTFALRQLR
jgi:hypothetical protein